MNTSSDESYITCVIFPYDRVISDDAIEASGYLNGADHGDGAMWRSRLDNDQAAWCPGDAEASPHLEWDLGGLRRVSRVQTRGWGDTTEGDHWVTEYDVKYSVDGTWVDLAVAMSGVVGNANADGTVSRDISPPIVARKVRLYPTAWSGKACMRAEWLGCEALEIACANGCSTDTAVYLATACDAGVSDGAHAGVAGASSPAASLKEHPDENKW